MARLSLSMNPCEGNHHEHLLDDDETATIITQHEEEAMHRCLEAVEQQAAKRQHEGFSTNTFFFGVMNTIVVAWTFGAFPEYFWMLYLVETCVLFPVRWSHQVHAEPLKCNYYWLDFCWIANFAANLSMGLLIFADIFGLATTLTDDHRKGMFCVFWGISCGPLLLAAGLLGNALVFHSADNLASVFIHLFPALSVYHFRWNTELVKDAFPHLFKLDYLSAVNVWTDIYAHTFLWYILWWVIYTAWLLACGLKLPQRGYDTVFHANMRGALGMKLAVKWRTKEEHIKRSKSNEFPAKDALIYMILHMVAVAIAILVAIPCFHYRAFHAMLIATMATLICYNGAKKYSYFMLKSYSLVIKKQLSEMREHSGKATA